MRRLAEICDAAVEIQSELMVIVPPALVVMEAVNAQLDAVVPPDVIAISDQDVVPDFDSEVEEVLIPGTAQDRAGIV